VNDYCLAALGNAEYAVANDRRSVDDGEASRRLWKFMMLCPTLELFIAMAQGQSVPAASLDPEWVKRFGKKRGD